MSDYYLIHPSLTATIRDHKLDAAFHVLQHIIVGHDYEWRAWYPQLIDLEKAVMEITEADLGSEIHGMIEYSIDFAVEVSFLEGAGVLEILDIFDELERMGYGEIVRKFKCFLSAMQATDVD